MATAWCKARGAICRRSPQPSARSPCVRWRERQASPRSRLALSPRLIRARPRRGLTTISPLAAIGHRAYDGFHEACGLWLLSTIAARRVVLPWGGRDLHPALYLALVSRSTIFTKTTAAMVATDVLTRAIGDDLLLPERATPQALIREMAGNVAADYGDLPFAEQNRESARIAFAGQRGWFKDEFGGLLDGMMRREGPLADFRSLLREFFDGKDRSADLTIARGKVTIDRPYLALLASMTPSDLRRHARSGSQLWGDGFFARIAFIAPPGDAPPSNARWAAGRIAMPAQIVDPLRAWHARLGIPEVAIEERMKVNPKGKRKPTGTYDAQLHAPAPVQLTLGPGVLEAYYAYHDGIRDLLTHHANEDVDASYGRLPNMALCVAILLASVAGEPVIALTHWARAAQIAERWRQGLHQLIDQLRTARAESRESEDEAKLMRVLNRGVPMTAREIGQYAPRPRKSVDTLLRLLVDAGDVLALSPGEGQKTTRYLLVERTVETNTVASTVSTVLRSTVDTPPPPAEPYAPVDEPSVERRSVESVETPPESSTVDGTPGNTGEEDDLFAGAPPPLRTDAPDAAAIALGASHTLEDLAAARRAVVQMSVMAKSGQRQRLAGGPNETRLFGDFARARNIHPAALALALQEDQGGSAPL